MSPKAHVLRLDLPGHWADGWLYKEHLILWSDVGQMLVCPVSSLVDSVQQQVDHEIAVLADFLVFRTDWKRGAPFGRLLSLPGVEEIFVAAFGGTADEVVIQVPDAQLESISVEQAPGFMLDSGIYNNCVYAGTTEGLFETRFDPDDPTSGAKLIQRLDKPVSALTARYSVVNTSAGDAGLWLSRMDFNEETWWKNRFPAKLVADYSRGNSFAERDLLNYTDDPFPGFLRSAGEKEKDPLDGDSDRWRITGYGVPSDIGGVMRSALGIGGIDALFDLEPDRAPGQLEVLGNAGKRLLVAYGDSLRVVSLTVSRRMHDIQARASDAFPGFSDPAVDPTDILSTHAVEDGFLVEFQNEVRLINPEGSYPLISEPVAHIRTFANSRRYPDVVLMIREDCVSLLGTYVTTQQDD